MTNADTDEVFSTEFRHDVVMKFVKGLVDGSIKIETDGRSKEGKELIARYASQIVNDVNKYVSRRVDGESLDDVEHRIFSIIAILRSGNVLIDEPSTSQVEEEIKRLHAKIDSTNSLLAEILRILKELVK